MGPYNSDDVEKDEASNCGGDSCGLRAFRLLANPIAGPHGQANQQQHFFKRAPREIQSWQSVPDKRHLVLS